MGFVTDKLINKILNFSVLISKMVNIDIYNQQKSC